MRIRQSILLAAACIASSVSAAPAGKSFTDCTDCPEMVPLPAGSFTMGIAAEREIAFGMPAPQAGKAEPVHKVTFRKGFAMAKYPVTVAQFRAFIDESGYRASDSCYTQHKVDGHYIYENVRGFSWRSPGFPQDDDHPVVCVSAEDGEAYANGPAAAAFPLFNQPFRLFPVSLLVLILALAELLFEKLVHQIHRHSCYTTREELVARCIISSNFFLAYDTCHLEVPSLISSSLPISLWV